MSHLSRALQSSLTRLHQSDDKTKSRTALKKNSTPANKELGNGDISPCLTRSSKTLCTCSPTAGRISARAYVYFYLAILRADPNDMIILIVLYDEQFHVS